MRKAKIIAMCFLVCSLALGIMMPPVCAGEEFKMTALDVREHKGLLDDPRPYLKGLYKKILPPEIYAKLTYDVEAMKKLWAEIVGFKAPDVVGKIAPEIKPGTYSYRDKEKYPGLKELMIPDSYNRRFKPGGPPHAGNFPEIKVIPTRQYYWALPVGEATKKYEGHTKLDDQGIMRDETYMAGYPFPRPSGKFKANQIIYNWLRRYLNWESNYLSLDSICLTGDLRKDNDLMMAGWNVRFQGRVLIEPYGWLDERAQKLNEYRGFAYKYLGPRDMFGNILASIQYSEPDKFDQMMLYVNVLRRMRVLSATDIQDVVGGADCLYCDNELFSQKLSKTVFPYECEVIAEREYLIPFATLDGSGYLSSKGYEYHNLEFERRPMYVVKMAQLDKNFVYSYRILYIDKETFMLYYIENYDQKGRLYRNSEAMAMFLPKMGMFNIHDVLYRDHIDLHNTWFRVFITPAPWVGRKQVSLGSLFRKGK